MDAIQKFIYQDCIHSTYNIPFIEIKTLTDLELLYIFNNIGNGYIPHFTFDISNRRINILEEVMDGVVYYKSRKQSHGYFESIQDALKFEATRRVGIPMSFTKSKDCSVYCIYIVEERESVDLLIWLLMTR